MELKGGGDLRANWKGWPAPGLWEDRGSGFPGTEGWAPPPHPLVPTCQVGLLGFLMLLFLLDPVALLWVYSFSYKTK